jgi:hypothetical protein
MTGSRPGIQAERSRRRARSAGAVRRACGTRLLACTAHRQQAILGSHHPQAPVRGYPRGPGHPEPRLPCRTTPAPGLWLQLWLQFITVRAMPGRYASQVTDVPGPARTVDIRSFNPRVSGFEPRHLADQRLVDGALSLPPGQLMTPGGS